MTGFYAGQVYGNLGAFIQVTGDPVDGAVSLDSSDVRYVDSFKLFGKDAYCGVDRQQFADRAGCLEHDAGLRLAAVRRRRSRRRSRRPARTSKAAGAPGVAGAGAYIFWNDMLYAELTAYGGLSKTRSEALGDAARPNARRCSGRRSPTGGSRSSRTGATITSMVGTFGMYGQIVPGERVRLRRPTTTPTSASTRSTSTTATNTA